MKHLDWINAVRAGFDGDLPGEDAQMLMSPLGRTTHSKALKMIPNPTPSAVWIHLFPKRETTHVVLMERNSYDGHHSGQISFPGGKLEEEDSNLKQTALREFEEEMGVATSDFELLGKLSPLIVPPSGFIIHPYVGFSTTDLDFTPDPGEVASVLQTPLDYLFSEESKDVDLVHSSSTGFKLKAPVYRVEQHLVWGATAMILSELEQMIKSSGI